MENNENNHEQEQENQHEQETHTAREIELEQAVNTLTEKVKELTAINQKLYVKFGGENAAPEKTDVERTDELLCKYIGAHFDPKILQEV